MTDRLRKADKLQKLAEYKRAREGGKREFTERDSVLYDEVTEDQYRSVVKGRQAQDDFVVDDGVSGYVDNGMDDWGQEDEYTSEQEDQSRGKSKKKKSVSSKPKAKYEDYVKPKSKAPLEEPKGMSAYRPSFSADQEADFMANLLGDVESITPTIPSSTRRTRKRPKSNYYELSDGEDNTGLSRLRTTGYRSNYREDIGNSSDGFEVPGGNASSDDRELMDDLANPRKRVRTNGALDPALERISKLEVKSDHEDAGFNLEDTFDDFEMDDPEADLVGVKKEEIEAKLPSAPENPKPSAPKMNGIKKEDPTAPAAWLAVYDSLNVKQEGKLDSNDAASTQVPGTASARKDSIFEPDGSLRFFWLDYIEQEGELYFIGKVKEKGTGVWVSICVTVKNLKRNLFILPREYRVEEVLESDPEEDKDITDEDGEEPPRKKKAKRTKLVETGEKPTIVDLHNDFDQVRKRFSISKFSAKFVKRRYAFSERGVPREEREWLKVVYGFDEPQISSDCSSPNFSKIFGTNTSAFELLVLKRKIMGPCWLQIKKPELPQKNTRTSWCKYEAIVTDPKDFNPFLDTDPDAPKDVPPLTIMSISLRTIVNHAENKREIVCVSTRTWNNLHIEDLTPPEQLPCTVQTYIRPIVQFPPNFEERARINGRGKITPLMQERTLLNQLLVSIYKADPDVLVGHDFLGSSLDVLLSRMREHKVDKWSRIGRFYRTKWLNIGRQGTNIKFLNGRMVCDLASDGAKTMIASTTWSLTEMCRTHLKIERQDIDPDDTAAYFDSSVQTPDHLMEFVRHCELDAHLQMAIASRVQILPLTKQLTNLAGNSWNRTLNGGRAERNEYILLHEFHRLKYICPDKYWNRGKLKAIAAEPEPGEEGEGGMVKAGKGKRDKYKGGLVFDPKRGLWDKYILVMDFNSLYPSIIQEYNIDFTTIDPMEDDDGEDKIPEPPSSGTQQGVLPRLIATLVQRRRQVKALMKDRLVTPARLAQYDIKQQALKLTANSMYGCLGFEASRFYARPLAALTTYKGREILTHTKELAESLQLEVVYGDTDSVFVNSNVTELADALKTAAELKKVVNDQYKLLEIDLDGVFQRLLLLQKKKYAAVKVEDATRTSIEVKGLDMKRREYSALSKNISQYVLDQILSGEMTEIVIERIHEYLITKGNDIREGKVGLDEFIIYKRLGKNPEDYPDAKSQPHVQVALRMKARGGTARGGDVIPYVFCVAEGSDAAKASQAELAKHPDEIRKAENNLKIDYDFYLSHQVLPPIERLCDPIEGTDRARLAECLGLDPGRYRTSNAEERKFASLDSQLSDQERFKLCQPLNFVCRKCHKEATYTPVNDREKQHILQPSGPICPNPDCSAPMTSPSLQSQLEAQIRAYISTYYEGWVSCDEETCEYETRMMSVYGDHCLRPSCRGRVSFKYTNAMLYNQLRFFSTLFDDVHILSKVAKSEKDRDTTLLVSSNHMFMRSMKAIVDKYMDKSGRRWVEMENLFSFMNI